MKNIIKMALGLFSAVFVVTSAAAALIDIGKPYLVPKVKTSADFSNVVYIDPDASTNGAGTLQDPKNTLAGLTLASDTAYLIKAGTVLNERLYQPPGNFYLGRYGQGANPILRGSDQMVVIGTVSDVTLDGVDIEKYGTGNYDKILGLSTSASHVTFANLRVVGLIGAGGVYPHYGLNSKCQFLTFYQCEIAYVKSDTLYPNSISDMTVVSCYIHHVNMSEGPGDGLQIGADSHRLYFANNYVDRGHTTGKFGLAAITDGGTDIVCEWNTFVSPLAGNGGSAIFWVVGDRNICSKNLIISTSVISGIASFDVCANRPAPYGVRNNHFYGPGNMFYGFTPTATDNYSFADLAAYESYLQANNLAAYGSDLFTTPTDTTAPSVPQNVAGYSVLNTIHLSWSASTDDVGLAGYRVYRDGNWVGTTTSPSFEDSDLGYGTTYTYTVLAFDGADNFSASSAAINITSGPSTDPEAPTVPTGLSADSATHNTMTLSWNASTDNVGVAGYYVYVDGTNPVDVGNVTSATITGLAPEVTYAFAVSAYDASANESALSTSINATTASTAANLPSGWAFTDIGNVVLAGSAVYGAGAFTIEGAGPDIWLTADGFAYVYTTLSGDGTITARVTSQENTNGWAKCGVMMRETLDADSEHALMAITPGGNSSFIRRVGWAGASSSSTNVAGASTPWWVRLVRVDDTFTGYVSADGQSWTLINSATLDTGSDIYVGLAVCSHTTSELCTAVLDNVALTGGTPDMEAPTTPANLVASNATDESIDLAWTASTDNVGVAGYKVYVDTVAIDVGNDTSVTVGDLDADTAYSFAVSAYDAQGNESALSSTVQATTLPPPDTQAPTAPSVLSATADEVSAMLSWTASTDNVGVTGYRILRDSVEIATTTATSYTDTGLTASTTYLYAVSAYDAAANESSATSLSVTTDTASGALPSGWTYADIGSVGVAGNVFHSGGEYTIQASGADIWFNVDAFGYAYTTLSGDGSITARVTAQQNTNSFAKSGVMIRETLDANSKHLLMAITPGGNSSLTQRVGWAGAGSGSTNVPGASTPWWVRLERSGNLISGYVSSDGQTWTFINSATMSAGTDVYIGLAVCSHNNSVLNTTVIDNVTVVGDEW